MSGFDNITTLSEDEIAFCERILSSDALAALLIHRIHAKIPTSLIRMSDGERAFIAHHLGAGQAGFMQDHKWLSRYGLVGADQKRVGEDLLWAGNHADFLACTISGLFHGAFVVHPYFPDRQLFVDQFWPQFLKTTDRVGPLLRAGKCLVLHREHQSIVPELSKRYGLDGVSGKTLNCWKDHERLLDEVAEHDASTVLVSGGASGKAFIVRLAQHTGKVVLDVGEAMQGCWTNSDEGWHDAMGKRPPGFVESP